MMSIRSLADFNGSSPGRCSDWLGTATVTARGLNLRDDTTNEGWGLLPGHHRGPPPGHTRGLSHGHGQAPRVPAERHPDQAARTITDDRTQFLGQERDADG